MKHWWTLTIRDPDTRTKVIEIPIAACYRNEAVAIGLTSPWHWQFRVEGAPMKLSFDPHDWPNDALIKAVASVAKANDCTPAELGRKYVMVRLGLAKEADAPWMPPGMQDAIAAAADRGLINIEG